MEKMVTYPFEFEAIPINDGVLDTLGFGQYEDSDGRSGVRRLKLHDDPPEYCTYPYSYNIGEHMPDPNNHTGYKAQRFSVGPWTSEAYFVHDIFEHVLLTGTTMDVGAFVHKLHNAKMLNAIQNYLRYK